MHLHRGGLPAGSGHQTCMSRFGIMTLNATDMLTIVSSGIAGAVLSGNVFPCDCSGISLVQVPPQINRNEDRHGMTGFRVDVITERREECGNEHIVHCCPEFMRGIFDHGQPVRRQCPDRKCPLFNTTNRGGERPLRMQGFRGCRHRYTLMFRKLREQFCKGTVRAGGGIFPAPGIRITITSGKGAVRRQSGHVRPLPHDAPRCTVCRFAPNGGCQGVVGGLFSDRVAG